MADYYFSQLDHPDKKAYRTIAADLEKMKKDIDIYCIDMDHLKQIISYIANDRPDLFYVDFHSLLFYQMGASLRWQVHYYYSPFETAWRRKAIEKTLCQLLASKPDVLRLPDISKCIWIHNTLFRQVSYNTQASQNPESSFEAYTAWGALQEHTAVCAGISNAAVLLGDRIGLKMALITGEGMMDKPGQYDYHAWNLVYIDGVPAHMDITWDSNLSQSLRKYRYDYFCISDADIGGDHRFHLNTECLPGMGLSFFERTKVFFPAWSACQEYLRRQIASNAEQLYFKLCDSRVTCRMVDDFVMKCASQQRMGSATVTMMHNEQQHIYMYLFRRGNL